MNGLIRLGRLAALLVLVTTLSSCYIPDKFKAELRLSRYGDWALAYEGDVMYAPILHDYAAGKITPANEEEKNNNIYNDLVRDPAVKDLKRVGKGRFHLKYERMGRLGKVQLTSLLRRDARLISLKSNEDNSIIVMANSVKPADAQRMAELGVNMEGEFRITTDANVVRHNATEVRQFGQFRVYVWKIENPLSPMPMLAMIRDIDPQRPLEDRKSSQK